MKKVNLKVGIILAINNQEDLNELARVTGAFAEDSILIDGEYVAYTDSDGAVDGMIWVISKDTYLEYNPMWDEKSRRFKSWIRSLK